MYLSIVFEKTAKHLICVKLWTFSILLPLQPQLSSRKKKVSNLQIFCLLKKTSQHKEFEGEIDKKKSY